MGYVAMALSLVNSHIVAALNANGCMAVGLSGVDASMTSSTALGSTWGRAGSPPVVRPNVIELLLDAGVTPVISPVAIDEEGRLLNCNADTTAGAVAAALEASLLLLSDIDQVRSDPDDPASVLGSLTRADVVHMLAEGTAREGMRPKVQAALDALDGGAPSVVLANGTRPHAFANTMSRTIPMTEITQ
jgi:acetylglutamate kinase